MVETLVFRCIICGQELREDEYEAENRLKHLLTSHIELVIALAEGIWELKPTASQAMAHGLTSTE